MLPRRALDMKLQKHCRSLPRTEFGGGSEQHWYSAVQPALCDIARLRGGANVREEFL